MVTDTFLHHNEHKNFAGSFLAKNFGDIDKFGDIGTFGDMGTKMEFIAEK